MFSSGYVIVDTAGPKTNGTTPMFHGKILKQNHTILASGQRLPQVVAIWDDGSIPPQ